MRQKAVFSLILWAFLAFGHPALPKTISTTEMCDAAALSAARKANVPEGILLSIGRVESGTFQNNKMSPWPWTINFNGTGHFFKTKTEAMDFAQNLIDDGNLNVDVGCFQINLRWHSLGFASLADAFDPVSNATYAANFLSKLYNEKLSWDDAIAAYHSRTPILAQAYLTKVKETWAAIQRSVSIAPPTIPTEESVAAPILTPRENTFPLLRAGQGINGSLVPAQSAASVRFSLR